MVAVRSIPIIPFAPPSRMVTFLFTDIEGSTHLWERDRATMQVALERHNAILDEAIRAHDGYHFKTSGAHPGVDTRRRSCGDVARAAGLDAEALEIRRELGDRLSIAHSLDSIAATVSRAGVPEIGARLYAASERLREELGAPIPLSERTHYGEELAMTRSALGDEAYERTWAAGCALSLDDAVAEALHIARQIARRAETPV